MALAALVVKDSTGFHLFQLVEKDKRLVG